jgi:hypothetical protein
MRIMSIALAVLLTTTMLTGANAAKRKLNCGLPHPDAACAVTPPVKPTAPMVTPANASADPTDTLGVIQALLSVKASFMNDLGAVATMAATINPATGVSWDPTALWCLNGTPAQGTQGQAGYVPAYPGLIAWIDSIVLPTTTTATPPAVPAGGGVAADAEEAWLTALAAYQDINPLVTSVVSNLTNLGPPQSVMNPCGALIQNRIQTVQNASLTVGSQLTMFNAILLQYLPKVAVVGHVRLLKH